MGCFIVCARPVEFHQKVHNFAKKRNLSLLWLSPFSKMERPYGGPKDLGFFVFFFHQCGNQWVAGDIPCAWCVEAHKQVKVSFLSLLSAHDVPKTTLTCVSNWAFDFWGVLLGVCFLEMVMISWSRILCAIPRLIFAVISRARAWIILVKHHDCESQVSYTHFWDHFSKYVPHCILSIFSN